jgi:hypothetical protein
MISDEMRSGQTISDEMRSGETISGEKIGINDIR